MIGNIQDAHCIEHIYQVKYNAALVEKPIYLASCSLSDSVL